MRRGMKVRALAGITAVVMLASGMTGRAEPQGEDKSGSQEPQESEVDRISRYGKAAFYDLLADREKEEEGSFYLLDLNQDGVDELLYSRSPMGYMGYLEIYAYSGDSLVSDDIWHNISSITYRANEKALLVESLMWSDCKKSVLTFDGSSLKHEYGSFSLMYEFSPEEALVSYSDFRSRMLKYDGVKSWSGQHMAEIYQSYVNEWNSMQHLEETYHCSQESEEDVKNILFEGVENTPANREEFLT